MVARFLTRSMKDPFELFPVEIVSDRAYSNLFRSVNYSHVVAVAQFRFAEFRFFHSIPHSPFWRWGWT
jgi:hypothetical protein